MPIFWNTFRRKVDPNLTFQIASNRRQQAPTQQQQQQQPPAVRKRKPAKVQYHSLAFDLLNTDNRQDYNSAAAFQATKPGIKIEPLTHSYTAILGRFNFSENENQTTNKRQNHFDQQNSFGDKFRSTVSASVF